MRSLPYDLESMLSSSDMRLKVLNKKFMNTPKSINFFLNNNTPLNNKDNGRDAKLTFARISFS